MSVTGMIVLTVILTIGMIGLVLWYLKAGYSYKHTIDEMPEGEYWENKKDVQG